MIWTSTICMLIRSYKVITCGHKFDVSFLPDILYIPGVIFLCLAPHTIVGIRCPCFRFTIALKVRTVYLRFSLQPRQFLGLNRRDNYVCATLCYASVCSFVVNSLTTGGLDEIVDKYNFRVVILSLLMAAVSLVNLSLEQCHWALLISQPCRQALAINWAKVDPDLYRHMA